jgi:hypothetical protein
MGRRDARAAGGTMWRWRAVQRTARTVLDRASSSGSNACVTAVDRRRGPLSRRCRGRSTAAARSRHTALWVSGDRRTPPGRGRRYRRAGGTDDDRACCATDPAVGGRAHGGVECGWARGRGVRSSAGRRPPARSRGRDPLPPSRRPDERVRRGSRCLARHPLRRLAQSRSDRRRGEPRYARAPHVLLGPFKRLAMWSYWRSRHRGRRPLRRDPGAVEGVLRVASLGSTAAVFAWGTLLLRVPDASRPWSAAAAWWTLRSAPVASSGSPLAPAGEVSRV